MSGIMNIYNDCIQDGFTEKQSKRIAIIYEKREEVNAIDIVSVKKDILDTRNDVRDIKISLAEMRTEMKAAFKISNNVISGILIGIIVLIIQRAFS